MVRTKTFILGAITLVALSLLSEPGYSLERRKKKHAKDTTEVSKPDTYGDLVKKARITEGMVKILTVGNDYYFEVADSLMGRDLLIVNKVSGVPYELNDAGLNRGMESNDKLVRFYKDKSMNKVWVTTYNGKVSVPEEDAISESVKANYRESVIEYFPIEAYGKDSTSVVIKVNKIFDGSEKSFNDIYNEIALGGSVKKDLSKILGVKVFPKNVVVKALMTTQVVDGGVAVPLTVETTTNLVLLPKVPMKPRFADPRVGFFATEHIYFTDEQQQVEKREFVHRWRLEPQKEDLEKYFKGELVEPMKPIVFYVDTAFPEKWRTVVKQGIEDWNMAFQTAGFKNVVKALDYPSNDPNFDPDDMRYSCVKYAATSIANAMGPSYIDPRTGEILTADVIWYHNVISLLHNWRFVQTAAVDSRVRKAVFDDEVMQEAIRYAAAHEIGHTLGLMHNMGASYSFPVDSLRSPEFTQRYGTTPSIMDYARNNYIAQPGDLEKGVKLTPPILGVYDIHAINWGYRLIQGADTPEKEKKTLDAWIEEKKADPMYEFGAQQVFGVVDPTDQSEDLGNDHLKAGDMAIHNLKIIMKNLETWTFDEGARYDDVENMYIEVVRQYTRHLRHVMPYIGGIRFQEVRQGEDASAKNYIDKAMQKKAMLWLLNQARTYNDWLTPKELIVKLDVNMNVNDKLQSSVVGALLNSAALYRINEGGQMNPKINYTLNAYLDDAFSEMFKPTYQGVKLSQADMNIQSAAVALMINYTGLGKAAEKKASTALADYEEVLRQTCEPALPCSHIHGHESSFTRINFGLPTLSKEQLAAVMTGRLNKIAQLYKSRRAASTGDTRDFYDYQLLLIERTLKNN